MNPEKSQMQHEPDESWCLFGAEALLKRLNALAQEIGGVREAEDIECIHRMRVASRRLRSALALFNQCFPDGSVKKWKKRIRLITRSLGSARDLDVQIDFLQTFLTNLEELRYHAGIKRLILRLRQQRGKLQIRVLEAIDKLEENSVLKEMEELSQQIRAHALLHHVDERPLSIYQRSYLAISSRLGKLVAYEPYVHQPDRVEELHAMRIAAKRLRYTMEVFAPLYQDELERPLEAAREAQTKLGDLHDCYLWTQYLPQFMEEERIRMLEYFGHTRTFSRLKSGILHLQQDRQQHWTGYYEEFLGFWLQIQNQGVWEDLLRHISHQALG